MWGGALSRTKSLKTTIVECDALLSVCLFGNYYTLYRPCKVQQMNLKWQHQRTIMFIWIPLRSLYALLVVDTHPYQASGSDHSHCHYPIQARFSQLFSHTRIYHGCRMSCVYGRPLTCCIRESFRSHWSSEPRIGLKPLGAKICSLVSGPQARLCEFVSWH